MRTIAIWTISTLLLSATITGAADDAAAIIDKAIKANGGEEKLAKYKAEQWKAKGTMEAMGMKMTYTADYFFQRPAMLRFDIAVEVGGQKVAFSAATDGKTSWEKMGDMVRDMEKKKAEAFQHNLYTMSLSQLLPLKGKEFTLTVADEIKIDGKPAVGVQVGHADHPTVVMYFDKASGLLVKTQTKIWDEFADKIVTQEVFIIGWKAKDGRKYFDKLVIKREGKVMIEEEFSDQKSLEKHDPKLFAKP